MEAHFGQSNQVGWVAVPLVTTPIGTIEDMGTQSIL
jgi:hypothetical protein